MQKDIIGVSLNFLEIWQRLMIVPTYRTRWSGIVLSGCGGSTVLRSGQYDLEQSIQ
jgi:hypothetical protein